VKNPKAIELSNEFKVASKIYESNLHGDKVWYSKLANLMQDWMGPAEVLKSIRCLCAWGIIKAEYGLIESNKAGRLLYVTGESKTTIKEIYEAFWKT
jgi:hypothetical protein